VITLDPPYPVVDGYALLPDHADPGLFYALPTAPSLAMMDGRPALSLIQYLGGGAGASKISGGILQLTTELRIPEEDLAGLGAGLSRQRNLTGREPRVIPVSFDTGTVELAVLGRTNTPPPEGSAAPGGTFEVQFSAGGKPSLGNTNTSAFQLILNENAAELIGACIDKPELPVLVTYVMTFAALRPSFTIDIHADWHKVYKTLQQKFTANAWVAAADVDVAITDALETSGVDIDTVIMGTGDGSAAAAQKTKQQLLDWVLERLFQPMSPPEPPGSGIGQAIGDAVWSLTRAILPGVSYKLKMVDENQLRHLDVRAKERVAEVRELRPQGMLGGLLRSLRVDEHGAPNPAWPSIRAGMLQQVELSGFPRLEVGVDLVDRFATDGVRACRVQLARKLPSGEHADDAELSFTASNAGHRDWVVNLLDDAARSAVWDTPYEYRVLVDFDPSSALRPAGAVTGQIESEWKVQRARDLLADPREAYAVTDVTITTAPLFSFALFGAVTVELRPPGSSAGTARVILKPDAATQTWRYSSAGAQGQPYSWRATYHRPLEAGGDVSTEWAESAEPWLSLPDPMPEKLAVNFFVDLPWAEITAALLELRYDDAEHDVHYAEETVTLGPDTPVLSRTYSIAAGGSRALGYRLTIKLATGGLVEGSWREATDDRIVVDRRLVDERQVRLRVIGGPMSALNLIDSYVDLQARDAAGAVKASTKIRIQPGQEQGFQAAFSYLRGDPPINTVYHQVTTVDSSGFVRTQPWTASTADLLVLDLRTQTITG
jgi:hypothetical protein